MSDSLLNIGPCGVATIGEPAFLSEEFEANSAKDNAPDLELVLTSGHGKNGALTIMQRAIRPQVSFSRAHTRVNTHTHAHAIMQTATATHKHVRMHARTLKKTHTRTLAQSHSRTHTNSHSHTHFHTHGRSPPPFSFNHHFLRPLPPRLTPTHPRRSYFPYLPRSEPHPRSSRPAQVVTTFELPGCVDMWTLYGGDDASNNDGLDDEAHALLILCRQDATMVLQTGQEIMELDQSGFATQGPTVFAANIGNDKFIVQVRVGVRTCVCCCC